MGPLADHWTLDPSIAFLNHGSFGACPRHVLQLQQQLRERLERQPVQFLVRDLEPLIDAAREDLARFVGADPQDLVFVPNATYGVGSVLRSLPLRAGDELVTTDHEYNACKNVLDFVAQQCGARVVVAPIPFPLESADEIVESIRRALTPRTRLLLIDHVTSPTGIVMPLAEIIREAQALGVDVLVDGAHAPGMVPLNLSTLGAAYYTGNCHKWICAPKGAALLWVRRSLQSTVRPLAISHGANSPRTDRSRFQIEFDWTGTHDPTPFLCISEAIRFIGGLLPGGWNAVRESNRDKALRARQVLCEALEIAPPCPDGLIGSLASVPLPDGSLDAPRTPLYADPLQDELLLKHRIEVPIVPWPRAPKRLLRVSAQLYNSDAQYEQLARALKALGLGRTQLA